VEGSRFAAVAFSCAHCGSGSFSSPSESSNPSIVTCRSCGNVIGTVGEIEGAAKNALGGFDKEPNSDELREAFRKAFETFKAIRIK
jgi:hypothetical protein